MDTLLCNDDGDVIIGTYQPSNTLLSLRADQYTAGSATWSDQSGNGLDFTVSTNASLKGTDADGFPYLNFSGSYGHATRLVGSTLTNIPAPTTTVTGGVLLGAGATDHSIYDLFIFSSQLSDYDESFIEWNAA